ncbi:MAG TPA: metal ABC transporter ATP-binding protein [Synergistaceae bacterium]|nr:metal ABC transporter ATP-binding protein [Synergistaceae bacterium]HQF91572.1 metal ABC transporter ATP-binding protein [Synergistaceae bacterium]HQH77712.1 metal ABC transporter ATP-binding protein [Synergistaceae bacterium]HQK24116.1 metal ABC transporter ATP-binding protein [Synergistaceae bacterium]
MTIDIALRGVSFSFGKRTVLSEVSFSVPSGEFLVLLGPNGGGKSTLLRLILGLLTPSRGTLSVLGMPPAQAVSRLGYVPQDVGRHGDFPVTVRDVVLMGRRGIRPEAASQDASRVEMALEQVDLWAARDLRMGDLSHGQRQRTLIARALCSEPAMLLLDEPTASVDAAIQERLYKLLKKINDTMTIVMVSHDIMAVTSCATAVACVNEQVFYHPRGEILPEMIQRAYGSCPVELVAHGVPHRVLAPHRAEEETVGRNSHETPRRGPSGGDGGA